jgi:hypothetical protein
MELPPRWWLPAGLGLVGGGVGAVLLSRRSAAQKLLNGAVPPTGNAKAALLAGLPSPPAGSQVVPKTNTGGSTWLADRYASLQRQGITGDQAHAIVALWALESNAGAGEWNYNVGNYAAPAGTPLVYHAVPNGTHRTSSGGLVDQYGNPAPEWWIAYTSLDAGTGDWITRTQAHTTCWSDLQSAPLQTTWLQCVLTYYLGSNPSAASVNAYIAGWQSRLTSTALSA